MTTTALVRPAPKTTTQAQTRLLLALWDMESAGEVKKSDLMNRIRSKGQNYADILQQLERDQAIVLSNKKPQTISLADAGKQMLEQGLKSDQFAFDSNIGAKTANALLKWLRQTKPSAVTTNGNGKVAKAEIGSYEEFKRVALQVYDRLNRDYNLDNLVPIYRIRREIGEQVTRSQFSEWLFAMQADDLLKLLEEGVEDSTTDKIQDSVMNKLGKLRCYATRPNVD